MPCIYQYLCSTIVLIFLFCWLIKIKRAEKGQCMCTDRQINPFFFALLFKHWIKLRTKTRYFCIQKRKKNILQKRSMYDLQKLPDWQYWKPKSLFSHKINIIQQQLWILVLIFLPVLSDITSLISKENNFASSKVKKKRGYFFLSF